MLCDMQLLQRATGNLLKPSLHSFMRNSSNNTCCTSKHFIKSLKYNEGNPSLVRYFQITKQQQNFIENILFPKLLLWFEILNVENGITSN